MKRDFIISFVTEFAVLATSLLIYKFAASMLGTEGFSEFALSRRAVAFIQPAVLMGLGVGIPRYMAITTARSRGKSQDAYFITGFCILAVALFVVTVIMSLFADGFAFLIFGKIQYTYLIVAVNLMLAGMILHIACYSYFRGKLLIAKANLLQIVNLCLVPLIAFSLGDSAQKVLLINGSVCAIVSSLIIFAVYIKRGKNINITSHARELFSYGIQRVPGDFGLSALLALPAILTAHVAGVQEAGYVAFGIAVFNMAGRSAAPLGIVLLPKVSQVISNGDFGLLTSYISRITKMSLILSVTGVILFEFTAEWIILLFLGERYMGAVFTIRIMMTGSIAYIVYASMRSIIDACFVKAVNTVNIFISLCLFILLSSITLLFHKEYYYIVSAFVVSVYLLGILTLLTTRKISAMPLKLNIAK